GIDHYFQIALARLQSLFSLFAIIDVCKQEIPGGYCTFRIPHREAANLKPSVNAISTPATVLNVIDLPRFDGLHTGLDYPRKIIRMNGIDEGPVLQLPMCFAEILQGLAVQKLHLAHCTRGSHKPGNVVDDLPPGQFPRTQGLLSPLAILDIHMGSVPFDDFP